MARDLKHDTRARRRDREREVRASRRSLRPADKYQRWLDSLVGSLECGFDFDAEDYVDPAGE